MMLLKTLMLITILPSTQLAYAENHMLIVGGGGEPKSEKTIFDNGMTLLGKNLASSKWKYEVSFNGDHRETESILQNQFNNGVKPTSNFTENNFNKMIENYRKKILNNEITSNDQLMIIINTHGAQRNPGESTHSISLKGGAAT